MALHPIDLGHVPTDPVASGSDSRVCRNCPATWKALDSHTWPRTRCREERYDDVVIAAGNGYAQPEVLVRAWYTADGEPLPKFEVIVGGWPLKDQYATRLGAHGSAEREVELARTRRRGHHW